MDSSNEASVTHNVLDQHSHGTALEGIAHVGKQPKELKDIHLLPQEVINSELALKDKVVTSEPQRIQNSCAGAQSDCEVPSWDEVDGQGGGSYDRGTLGGCCGDRNCKCSQEDCNTFCEVSVV